MKYQKKYTLVINEGTRKYSRVRPVKKTSIEYEIAIERITNKINSNSTQINLTGFSTLNEFIKWFNKAPNYKKVDFGLDYRI